ncbi:MAG: GAF domain-containing protein, partial [Rhodocyclaceae bacterium]|nr:GAF domain-containing protein [Rhodocyclaceae bacterium]
MQTPAGRPGAARGSARFVRKLALAVFAINAAFIAVVGAMLHESRGHAVDKAVVNVENLARVLDEHVEGTLGDIDIVVRIAADEVERQIAGGGIDTRRLNSFLERKRQQIRELDGLRVADASGDIVFGNDIPAGAKIVLADRDYFQRARAADGDTLVISRPLLSRVTGRWVLIFARRINGPGGAFAGIVYGVVDIDKFSRMFATLEMGPHDVVHLSAEDFTTIARYPNPPGAARAIGNMGIAPEILEQMRQGRRAFTVAATSPFDGRIRTVAFRTLQRYPLQIMVGVAPEDYLAPWRIEAARMSGLAAVFALTTTLFAWGAYRSWRQHATGMERLAASAARLNEAQRIARLGNWEWNLETDEQTWSDESFRIFGLQPQSVAVTCELFMSFVVPEARERLRAEINKAHAGDGPYSCEFGIVRGDGEVRHVFGRAMVVKDAKGKPLRLVGTNMDITERKRADAAREQVSRALRLLTDCNTALLRAANEQRLLNDVCRLIVETGGYLMAWVGYAQDDADKSVRPVAQSGRDEGYLHGIRVSWADTALGRGPTGQAIRTGITQINQNCLTNPAMAPWREAAVKRGYRSSIALPLISKGRTLGALSLYAAAADAFGLDEVLLFEELANNLAYGIETQRVHAMKAAADKELDGHRHRLEELIAQRTAELVAAKAEAERANDAKSRFLAAASHDLRQPLSALSLYVGALEGRLAPADGQLVANMRDCVANLSEMLSDLLDL